MPSSFNRSTRPSHGPRAAAVRKVVVNNSTTTGPFLADFKMLAHQRQSQLNRPVQRRTRWACCRRYRAPLCASPAVRLHWRAAVSLSQDSQFICPKGDSTTRTCVNRFHLAVGAFPQARRQVVGSGTNKVPFRAILRSMFAWRCALTTPTLYDRVIVAPFSNANSAVDVGGRLHRKSSLPRGASDP